MAPRPAPLILNAYECKGDERGSAGFQPAGFKFPMHKMARAGACALRGSLRSCSNATRSLQRRVNDVDECVAAQDPFAPDRIKVGKRFGGNGLFERLPGGL
jgi:hypothetical protein